MHVKTIFSLGFFFISIVTSVAKAALPFVESDHMMQVAQCYMFENLDDANRYHSSLNGTNAWGHTPKKYDGMIEVFSELHLNSDKPTSLGFLVVSAPKDEFPVKMAAKATIITTEESIKLSAEIDNEKINIELTSPNVQKLSQQNTIICGSIDW